MEFLVESGFLYFQTGNEKTHRKLPQKEIPNSGGQKIN
jgi:hypothetical protein